MSVARQIRLKTCSSKFSVPSGTSALNEVVVTSLNLTVAPAPWFQSLPVMLQPPFAFDRLPPVANAAHEHLTWLRTAELPLEHLDRVHFDVDKLAPHLGMGMKSLHERA